MNKNKSYYKSLENNTYYKLLQNNDYYLINPNIKSSLNTKFIFVKNKFKNTNITQTLLKFNVYPTY